MMGRRFIWRKPVTLTGRYYERARRMLLDIVDILNEAGVPYHMDYGTLLGLVRDGDLIPWDKDMDMSIVIDDLPAFRKCYLKLRLRGWRISEGYYTPRSHPAWGERALCSIKIRNRNLLFFGRGRTRMDVFIKYPHEESHWWALKGEICRADKHFLEGLGEIDYAGRKVKVPKDREKYLEYIYGDWRTPNPNFKTRTDDGSIVREPRQPAHT